VGGRGRVRGRYSPYNFLFITFEQEILEQYPKSYYA